MPAPVVIRGRKEQIILAFQDVIAVGFANGVQEVKNIDAVHRRIAAN